MCECVLPGNSELHSWLQLLDQAGLTTLDFLFFFQLFNIRPAEEGNIWPGCS